MSTTKLKLGVASAIAGVSLAGGALLLGAPWASAQTPQPTPQQQQPGAPGGQPGTPRNNGTPGQGGQQGQPGQPGQKGGDHDCPKDANGNMVPRGGSGPSGPGGSQQAPQGGNTPGGTSFGGGRTLRQ